MQSIKERLSHLKLIYTGDMSRQRWLATRRAFSMEQPIKFGGSTMGALLEVGDSTFTPSRAAIFADRIGLIPRPNKPNAYSAKGHRDENQILDDWRYATEDTKDLLDIHRAREQGPPLRNFEKFPYMIWNPEFPHLYGNLDALIVPDLAPLDAKFKGYNSIAAEELPHSKDVVQIHTYAMILGSDYGELAVQWGEVNYSTFHVQLRPQICEAIERESRDMAERVTNGLEIMSSDLPYQQKMHEIGLLMPDVGDKDNGLLSPVLREREELEVDAPDHIAIEIEEYLAAKGDEKAAKKRKSAAQAKIEKWMLETGVTKAIVSGTGLRQDGESVHLQK